MCVTTFFTQKQIMKRSGPVEGQAATVQRLMLYGMPLSLFVSGFFFPIGVLIYWVTNNLWTLGQQFFILRKMPPPGSAAAMAKAAADKPVVDPRTLAPKPGAKPVRPKPGRPGRRRRPPTAPPRRRRHTGTGRRPPPTVSANGDRPRRAGTPGRRAGSAEPAASASGDRDRRRRPARDACRQRRRTDHRARPAAAPT